MTVSGPSLIWVAIGLAIAGLGFVVWTVVSDWRRSADREPPA